MKPFYTFCLLILCTLSANAQVVINEYSASNMNTLSDGFGEYEDWIELYNAGSATVNLAGYYLSDNPNNPLKWKFEDNANISAGSHMVVYASGRDGYIAGSWNTNFKLTQTKGESIVLSDINGIAIDELEMELTQLDHSRGRQPDGSSNWYVFKDPTPLYSNDDADAYLDYVESPEFSLAAGFYTNAPISVSITVPANSVVRFTQDGSQPTNLNNEYTSPLNINQTKVLRATAFPLTDDYLPSFNANNTYFINVEHTIPVISIAGREVDNLLDGDYISPLGSFEYFKNNELIDEAEGEYNKHGNDSWAYDQRGIDYITRDQMGYKDEIVDQIFPTKQRDNFQRLILKAAANDNYPASGGAHIRDGYIHSLSDLAGLELDERTYEPCVLYVNGDYWGVYEIREKADDTDYTDYYYNQDEPYVDFIKTWGGTWEEYGSWDEWYPLRDFIFNNDMSIDANYQYAEERLEMLSLIDYMILNTFVVCKDWLNWNTAWWRGRNPDGEAKKWRYVLWDLDATFGHYVNYTGIPDDTPYADPCDNEELTSDFEGHVQLITSLMENETFHALYVNRFADMLNTYFSCDYMIGLLDQQINRIAPEMPAHVDRWGGSVNQWQNNVQEIRDFILERCGNVIDGGIVDCYEVSGPFNLTVNVFPENSPNYVKVNTIVPPTYPYTGQYFGEINLTFEALPADSWQFDHWEVANNVFGPDEEAEAISLAFQTNDVITAFFTPLVPCAAPSSFVADTTGQFTQIQWNSINNAISYEVQYRIAGTIDWEVFSNIGNATSLPDLQSCTNYELRLRTLCGNGVSSYSQYEFQTACAVNTTNLGLQHVSVYPNPFQDRFNLQMNLTESLPVAITLTDLSGKVLYQMNETLSAGPQILEIIPERELTDGIYILSVQTETGIWYEKVSRF
jgi:hypothetical protein